MEKITEKKSIREKTKSNSELELTTSIDERYFGIGEDKQNNLVLSYYENFHYYNK